MDKGKMIDEILYKFCESYGFDSRCDQSGKKCADMSCAIRLIATEIVNNHIPEGAVVLTKEKLIELNEKGFTFDTTTGGKINLIEMAREIERKETAKEILDEVSKHYAGSWLAELYRKYGLEVEE